MTAKTFCGLKPRATGQISGAEDGFIFQSFFVEGGESCYDNVSLALETAGVARIGRRKRIIEALEAVDLGDKIKSRAKDFQAGKNSVWRLLGRLSAGRKSYLLMSDW